MKFDATMTLLKTREELGNLLEAVLDVEFGLSYLSIYRGVESGVDTVNQ